MTRIKGGILHAKRRRGIVKHTKGFKWGRKSKMKLAKIAHYRAGQFAFAGRKNKKRERRGLWNIKINAAIREFGLSYSRFIDALKKQNITIDRKILADLAENHPKMFAAVVAKAK